ncbi:MAG: AbrB/MazE/SpoVT family DNA-binding domain-containing protein [Haloarculaceae archaeon]
MAPTRIEGTDPIVRKAQLAGGSTFTISLPKHWAERQSIERGSDVYLYPLEDRVVVAPVALAPETHSTTIAADDVDEVALTRRIRAAYAAGNDSIAVSATDGLGADERRLATRRLRDLVGFDVTTTRNGRVEARSLLDTAEVSLAQTVAQLRRLTTSMHLDAARAIAENDVERVATVDGQAADVDRQVALVHRQFTRALADVATLEHLETDRLTAFHHYRSATHLGDIAAHATAIACRAEDEQSERPPAAVGDALQIVAARLHDLVAAALDTPDGEFERGREEFEAVTAELEAVLADADVASVRYGRIVGRYRAAAATAATIATARVGRSGTDGG